MREDEALEGKQKSKFSVWFVATLLILFLGPFILGVLGVVLKALNDFFGFSPVSHGGLIAALHWVPILVYVSWPIGVLLIVIAVTFAILGGSSKKSEE